MFGHQSPSAPITPSLPVEGQREHHTMELPVEFTEATVLLTSPRPLSSPRSHPVLCLPQQRRFGPDHQEWCKVLRTGELGRCCGPSNTAVGDSPACVTLDGDESPTCILHVLVVIGAALHKRWLCASMSLLLAFCLPGAPPPFVAIYCSDPKWQKVSGVGFL